MIMNNIKSVSEKTNPSGKYIMSDEERLNVLASLILEIVSEEYAK